MGVLRARAKPTDDGGLVALLGDEDLEMRALRLLVQSDCDGELAADVATAQVARFDRILAIAAA